MHACCSVLPKRDFRKRGKKHKGSSSLGSSDNPARHRIISFNLPSFLLSTTAPTSSRVAGRKGWRTTRGGALPWPRRILVAGFPKILRGPERVRGATSLKINSVKEPTDIRGLRGDLTPQTRFLILSRSISLFVSLVFPFSLHALAYP